MTAKPKTFVFTAENKKTIKTIMARYPKRFRQSAVLPLLDLAQRQCKGWLPQEAIEGVAETLGLPAIKILEVASFYTLFNLKPVGRYHIQLCGTTPCWLCGAADIKAAIQNHLKIEEGGITKDGLFSLVEVECLGACVNAPMIQINDDFYEDLTTETTIDLLKNLAAGKKPKTGSLMGRQGAAPLGYKAKKGDANA